ncbi:MAG: TIGR04283 family arsenosugar biosynthesis glycosyltransferase [Cyanobacteria bacterium P01_A01_bin.135]
MLRCSIIIPVLNEASCIGLALRHLAQLHPPPFEIIVVDGGSTDGTQAAIAREIPLSPVPISLIDRPPGRALQMNAGARVANGEVLCFLHADTWVPQDLVTVMTQTLADPRVVAGGFISLMQGPTVTRWGTSLHNYLKTYYAPLLFRPHLFVKGLRLLFGDQVMFCSSQAFWTCGGFDPALPIMEDGDLCLQLAYLGRIRLVNRVVCSSDRRVAKWGPLRANVIYLMIGLLWGFGVPTPWLKRFYEDVR